MSDDLIERLRGTWKVVNADGTIIQDCAHGQHFEPDVSARRVLLSHLETSRKTTYIVLRTERNRILTYIEGGELSADGVEPVRWWAVFSRPDRFRWRRDDWPKDGVSTGEWIRCEDD